MGTHDDMREKRLSERLKAKPNDKLLHARSYRSRNQATNPSSLVHMPANFVGQQKDG